MHKDKQMKRLVNMAERRWPKTLNRTWPPKYWTWPKITMPWTFFKWIGPNMVYGCGKYLLNWLEGNSWSIWLLVRFVTKDDIKMMSVPKNMMIGLFLTIWILDESVIQNPTVLHQKKKAKDINIIFFFKKL